MGIKWFSTSADTFKGKVRPRKAPTVPKTKAPKYKEQPQKYRGPKVRKPHVERPFSDVPMAVSQVTAASGMDISLEELNSINNLSPISSIEWIFGGNDGCKKTADGALLCKNLGGKEWNSLESFIKGRKSGGGIAAGAGMYSYSHPGCTCQLRVTSDDGAENVLGPYS